MLHVFYCINVQTFFIVVINCSVQFTIDDAFQINVLINNLYTSNSWTIRTLSCLNIVTVIINNVETSWIVWVYYMILKEITVNSWVLVNTHDYWLVLMSTCEYWWVLVNTHEYWWILMSTVGSHVDWWILMSTGEYSWVLVNTHEYCWISCGLVGTHEYGWILMSTYEYSWVLVNTYLLILTKTSSPSA